MSVGVEFARSEKRVFKYIWQKAHPPDIDSRFDLFNKFNTFCRFRRDSRESVASSTVRLICVSFQHASIIPLWFVWTLTVWLVVWTTHVIDNHLCLLLWYLQHPYWGIDYNLPHSLPSHTLWPFNAGRMWSLISKTYQMYINYTLCWRLFDGRNHQQYVENDFWLKLICLRCLFLTKQSHDLLKIGFELVNMRRNMFLMKPFYVHSSRLRPASLEHQTSNKSRRDS